MLDDDVVVLSTLVVGDGVWRSTDEKTGPGMEEESGRLEFEGSIFELGVACRGVVDSFQPKSNEKGKKEMSKEKRKIRMEKEKKKKKKKKIPLPCHRLNLHRYQFHPK